MTPNPSHTQIVQSWLTACAPHTPVSRALEAIYQHVHTETIARQPLCQASGRCCNFEKHGHRLYVTGIEAAYMFARLEGDNRARATLEQVNAARTRGDCPYLINNLCTAHTIKPLGCRVYYCDPTAQRWQEELSEYALAQIRAIHDEHGLEYRYGEWRSMLEQVIEAVGASQDR